VQFHARNATGKAGERLVETFVEETLNFAYRKVGEPDIGIDGEIEILGENRSSTGGFLKVQVKTAKESLSGRRIRVPFDEDHLDYFASLTVPPILTVVSLTDKKIWWKPILHKDNYRGPRGGFRISLDPGTDELTRFSGIVLHMIGQRSNAMIVKYLIEEAEERLDDMDETESGGEYDIVTAEVWAQTIHSIDRTMRDAKCLLRYERRYSDEITAIETRFLKALERIEGRKSWFEENGVGDLLKQRYWGDED
jgi:hypothetical protein